MVPLLDGTRLRTRCWMSIEDEHGVDVEIPEESIVVVRNDPTMWTRAKNTETDEDIEVVYIEYKGHIVLADAEDLDPVGPLN